MASQRLLKALHIPEVWGPLPWIPAKVPSNICGRILQQLASHLHPMPSRAGVTAKDRAPAAVCMSSCSLFA